MSDTNSDETYWRRREELHRLLKQLGPRRSCSELAFRMQGSSNEIRAKLMSLRADDRAIYEVSRWTAL